MMAAYLTMDSRVGPGPLGQYILEILARGETVVIRPTDNLLGELAHLTRGTPEDGEEEPAIREG
jgi:hypothetical protein